MRSPRRNGVFGGRFRSYSSGLKSRLNRTRICFAGVDIPGTDKIDLESLEGTGEGAFGSLALFFWNIFFGAVLKGVFRNPPGFKNAAFRSLPEFCCSPLFIGVFEGSCVVKS